MDDGVDDGDDEEDGDILENESVETALQIAVNLDIERESILKTDVMQVCVASDSLIKMAGTSTCTAIPGNDDVVGVSAGESEEEETRGDAGERGLAVRDSDPT